ncbi:hypothetical protein [Proteus mirabilis]|uniref:hypothetical protein n=1 Tax=Proteus mirabilis TaxID=584 RepID=UPI0034D746D8
MSDILRRDPGLSNHEATATADNFFAGSVQTGANSYDPYISGYAFIFWLKVPSWLSNAEEFKAFSQKNFKGLQGIQNIDMDTEGIRAGFTQNETHHSKALQAKPSEFTLKFQNHAGSPMIKHYNEWVSGIRDPKTGIATYPKEFGLEYHSSNHTGELLYVVTRPDANNFEGNNIEFATLITSVQPKRILMEHFNFEAGSNEFSDGEMPLAGYLNIGEKVDKFAQQYAKDRVYNFITENSFDNINQYTG